MAATHKTVTLQSDDGIVATLSSLGARLVSLKWHGVETLFGGEPDYAGVICGRFANRIADGAFTLDGKRYELARNEPRATLHGGPKGFDKLPWTGEPVPKGVRYTLFSPDGDQGFPGAITATATYTLTRGLLACDLTAETTEPTVVNLTNHAYWNLAGSGDARNQTLQIFADRYTPADDRLIPVGQPLPVAGTRFDFRKARPIAEIYDINFCLTDARGELHHAATLADPKTKRSLELWTTEPGLQLYTAQHFSAPQTQYGAIALEPQTWPDAPNRPDFPSATLRPGETYGHRIEWRFFK